ncbi:peptidoglycan DD-metalloendopeptidase family protein [Flavobacterium granuli]|uniref:Murein DD-endopeptidase MepM/ murein hydrolase activator NlpD n=1 Tax=Flavobacterium granuli TaxID=280093 RepID=A0ABU1S007_9FLAO|nr:peptidoglycan DD-metalloendopeptidase family protein [Flavobacterium granuli]MDR6844374.1 murein DD-endopeptidase MepM/ murein hydrolase activator NlpD [Flavobacterium granuli]
MTPLETLFLDLKDIKVIDNAIPYSQYTPLDLSASNLELEQLNITDSSQFETYIEHLLYKNNAKVAHGGYNEIRSLYKRSAVFNDLNTEERNIHIGLDLWIKAGTPVLAALDGKVHSFQYNNNLGDYGPTIILKHQLEQHIFYTLYGHLSLESIASIKIGDFFAKGQQLATLGDNNVNGDYSPHLHFQIIKDIEDKSGDYPGVCSKSKLAFYLENCPDPNLLLKIY